MKLIDLFEARSNHNHPSQRKMVDMEPFEKYKNYSKEEINNLFVSFTEINKLGINPKTRNGRNPLGVYTYPLSLILDSGSHRMDMSVPFAGGAKYVWIVAPTKTILNLATYTDSEYKNDLSKLAQYASQTLDLPQDPILKIISFGSNYGPDEALWAGVTNLNRLLSMTREEIEWAKDKLSKFESQYHNGILSRFVRSNIQFNASRMNFVLRKVLGYSSVLDMHGSILGKGGRAKEQCVFLSTDAYKIVDHFNNTSVNDHGRKMSDKVRQFIKQSDIKKMDVVDEHGELDGTGRIANYDLYAKHIDKDIFEYVAINYAGEEFIGKINVSDRMVPQFLRQAIKTMFNID